MSGKAKLQVQYGMNNYKQKNAAKGKELLIKNYSCLGKLGESRGNPDSINTPTFRCSSLQFQHKKADKLKLEDEQKTHQKYNDLFSIIKHENIAIKDF